jgi:DNA repair exonuclease SbcCD ATPase subunit
MSRHLQIIQAMATTNEHTQHLKIRSTQMEMPSSASSGRITDDYDRKLRDTQEEMERNRLQIEELARKKQELEELTSRKRAFLSQQVELTEKLTAAITLIERGLNEIHEEAEDLEQCRACFSSHLDKIQKINPENWTRDNLPEKLDRATVSIDLAADEYDQAAAHFEGSRSGAIFGRASKRSRTNTKSKESGEFVSNLRNGLAFNLPILVLGGAALVIYLLK